MTIERGSSDTSPAGSHWLYALLLAIQTAGAILALSKGVPLYRQITRDLTSFEVENERLVWSISAIVLLQAGYWICYRVRPAPPHLEHPLLGHFVLFLGRLVFSVATTFFAFIFVVQGLADRLPTSRYYVTFIVLFALFCYSEELQRLGNRMSRRAEKPKD